ncbi:MAG: hypothetical protein KGD73_11190 [Candidatus Lokiarchaeota archaeon]|nr:hypothetical protein [Candidatus Lokiarchaeota archaeon]
MDEKSLVNSNARGFAGLIKSIMEPLNENPEFKEKYKNLDRKFLINASNLNHAALITVNQGVLKVESVPNKPDSNLKKKTIGWDGYISMDSQIFLALAMNRISIIGIGMKWLLRKVKMGGILKLLSLLSIFEFLKK